MGGSTRRAAVDPGTVTGPHEGDPWRPTATVLSDLLGGEHRRPAARSGRLQLRPVCEVTEAVAHRFTSGRRPLNPAV
jgi:hypothetical protein